MLTVLPIYFYNVFKKCSSSTRPCLAVRGCTKIVVQGFCLQLLSCVLAGGIGNASDGPLHKEEYKCVKDDARE